jgi:predicted DNA-binding transcriptional regulator AlpA
MNLQNRHFLSIKEVSSLIGISVSTINRGVEKGTFPPKHKLSTQRIVFLKYQIDKLIDGKRDNWYDIS